MPSTILNQLGELLEKKKLCIAAGESATAGRLCAELSLLAQSGTVLKGGIVCYDASLKTALLHISQDLIDRYTPESAEVTSALARSLGPLIPADIYVAITGLTTPGGSESPDKPVGTMFGHVLVNGSELKIRQVFSGESEAIVLQMIDRVAQELIGHLSSTK